jgi:hypothetical protein
MMKRLMIVVMAMAVALLPVTAALAAGLSISVPKTTLSVSNAGDIKVELVNGMPEDIDVVGREYTGAGIGVAIGGIDGMADVHVASNLHLVDAANLSFDHDGTICFTVGGDVLSLEYDGMANVTKDMVKHTKTVYSVGDFKVKDGTGAFADLKGVEGTYKLTIIEYGLKVGSTAGFKFSAMEVVEAAPAN